MIISEFLPNPVGKDTDGEWIKIFNNSSLSVDIKGWSIKDASGKTFKFSKETPVTPGGYFQLNYSASKISINNSGETLFLYDALGNLADKAEYSGSAPEGKPLIRQGNKFIFENSPTSKDGASVGSQNFSNETMPVENYSASAILNPPHLFNFPVLLALILTSLILSAVFVIVLRNTDVQD